MNQFENLNISPEILGALQHLGFEKPMPVQEQVIPLMLNTSDDIIALAQTGTGKTAAFGIPLVQMTNLSLRGPQALVLCPTRELCLQITSDLQNYAANTKGISILAVYGGASIEVQMRELKKGVHIVVATPGRLNDLIGRKAVKMENISTVVLDEADEMLNMGFEESIAEILEKVPATRRTLLFSATMPSNVAGIARKYMKPAVEVTIGTRNAVAANVTHVVYHVNGRNKYESMKRIIDSEPSIFAIVFCRTRRDTHEIASKLIADGYEADALHGDLSQAQRDSVMNKFRNRNIRLLVATDVAARGLDVDDLTHVINFDLPDDLEAYTHRSGRTGRANKKGISIALVSPREKNQLAQLQRLIKKTLNTAQIPSGKEICSNQMMHWVKKLDSVEVTHHVLRKMVPGIYDVLESLDKDELIRRLAGLEFEKLLNEYQNAPDPEPVEPGITQQGSKSRNRRFSGIEENFTRLSINLGKQDGLYPKELMGLVNKNLKGERITFGRIDLKRDSSIFEVESQQADYLVKSLKNVTFGNRRVDISFVRREKGAFGKGDQRNQNGKPFRKKNEFALQEAWS
ncbi:MAG TPA: DEAD/DEAH box helicase [Bacteroidales bacterium]|nr:DEAD/DEAH box helicase [Bacteroidales bacterium]